MIISGGLGLFIDDWEEDELDEELLEDEYFRLLRLLDLRRECLLDLRLLLRLLDSSLELLLSDDEEEEDDEDDEEDEDDDESSRSFDLSPFLSGLASQTHKVSPFLSSSPLQLLYPPTFHKSTLSLALSPNLPPPLP